MPNDIILDEEGLEAAADVLYRAGSHHSWWKSARTDWRELDPVGQDEFLSITHHIIVAYLSTVQGKSS